MIPKSRNNGLALRVLCCCKSVNKVSTGQASNSVDWCQIVGKRKWMCTSGQTRRILSLLLCTRPLSRCSPRAWLRLPGHVCRPIPDICAAGCNSKNVRTAEATVMQVVDRGRPFQDNTSAIGRIQMLPRRASSKTAWLRVMFDSKTSRARRQKFIIECKKRKGDTRSFRVNVSSGSGCCDVSRGRAS